MASARSHKATAQDERGADKARGCCFRTGPGADCESATLAACDGVSKTELIKHRNDGHFGCNARNCIFCVLSSNDLTLKV